MLRKELQPAAQIRNLQEENDSLRQENNYLKDRLKLLEERMINIEKKTNSWSPDSNQTAGLDIEEISKRVEENIRKREERKKRKNNIVLFNIPESNERNTEDRNQQDLERSERVIKNHLNIKEAEITEVVRLGYRPRPRDAGNEAPLGPDQKPRPLVVKIREYVHKWKIIAKAKELRNSGLPEIRKVGISPDMTKKEREENDKLRAELMQRREAGEENIKIHRGQIVKVGLQGQTEN